MAANTRQETHDGALRPCKEVLVKSPLDGPREWTIVELQGYFEARDASVQLAEQEIGPISGKKGDKKNVILTVGNQRLDGKLMDMPQPLGVMSKISRPRPQEEDAMSDPINDGVTEVEYEIVGFIRRKIVFSHR